MSREQVVIEPEIGILQVIPTEVDKEHVDFLRQAVSDCLTQEEVAEVQLDLKNVVYIGPDVVNFLVGATVRARVENQGVLIRNAKPSVMHILKVMNIIPHLDIEPTQDRPEHDET